MGASSKSGLWTIGTIMAGKMAATPAGLISLGTRCPVYGVVNTSYGDLTAAA